MIKQGFGLKSDLSELWRWESITVSEIKKTERRVHIDVTRFNWENLEPTFSKIDQ